MPQCSGKIFEKKKEKMASPKGYTLQENAIILYFPKYFNTSQAINPLRLLDISLFFFFHLLFYILLKLLFFSFIYIYSVRH